METLNSEIFWIGIGVNVQVALQLGKRLNKGL